jgi:uncharacterized Zn finger protein (UPF0148 family)
MNKTEVLCPNCGTSFKVCDCVNSKTPVSELKDGKYYLVPETIRNENVSKSDERMKALKEASIDVSKLQSLMQTDSNIKEIFSDPDDKILTELSKGGFIKNPELFRRWICAQTFRLLRDPKGWTHAVRERYNITYVFKQTKRELELLLKLERKGLKGKDVRFEFFTLDDMKEIFMQLTCYNHYCASGWNNIRERINNAKSYRQLYEVIDSTKWHVHGTNIPQRCLNCFKGAGAYYTLQNIIRTHGMILLNCKDMDESIRVTESIFNDIISYEPRFRRWDILLSVLTLAVNKAHFELKW